MAPLRRLVVKGPFRNIERQVQDRMEKVLTLFFTVRHLTRRQIVYRIYYGLRSIVSFPGGRAAARTYNRTLTLSPPILRKWDRRPHEFSFVGKTISFDHADAIEWYPPSASRLWQYHLHAFDYLVSDACISDAHTAKNLVVSWITRHKKPSSAAGWAAFPLSLRVVNWIKWMHAVQCYDPVIIESLSLQYGELLKKIEYNVLGNHLLKNIKAMVYCASCFSGEGKVLHKAVRLLCEEIDEQILKDGGHFELSPMYHAAVLEDLLDVYSIVLRNPVLFGKYPGLSSRLETTISRMLEWLEDMSFGNTPSFFNDVSQNESPTLAELRAYAVQSKVTINDRPPSLLTVKEDSGYSIIRLHPFRLIIDHGKVGPAYLPAHAHCDIFSFEVAKNDRRIFCNSGTDDYGNASTRQSLRSTRAHNTAMIDGQEQAEMWGTFRVARRPKQILSHVDETASHIYFEGKHDGYKHQKSFLADYTRKIRINKESGQITVEDIYTGEGLHTISSYLHFHPSVDVKPSGNKYSFSRSSDGISGSVEIHHCSCVEGAHQPFFEEFGCRQQHYCLSISSSKLSPTIVSYTVSINQ